MSTFNVPTKNEVSENNQAIFNQLEKGLGFVPNLYASFAHSETALGNFLAIGNGKTSFSAKEKEVINLAVSQVNECVYCLSAHTAIGKMNGFNEDQILELRAGEASFDSKLDALAKFARNVSYKQRSYNYRNCRKFLCSWLYKRKFSRCNYINWRNYNYKLLS